MANPTADRLTRLEQTRKSLHAVAEAFARPGPQFRGTDRSRAASDGWRLRDDEGADLRLYGTDLVKDGERVVLAGRSVAACLAASIGIPPEEPA